MKKKERKDQEQKKDVIPLEKAKNGFTTEDKNCQNFS